MKKALVLLVVLSMTSWAMGAPAMSFPVNRDAGQDMGSSDANSGAATMVRGAKATWREDSSFYDWDTAAIESFIGANGGTAMVSKVVFGVYPGTLWGRDLVNPDTVGIKVYGLQSQTDWMEGNGTSIWTNWNWTLGTAAVTENRAQAMWRWNDGGTPGITTDDFKELDPMSQDWIDVGGTARDLRDPQMWPIQNAKDLIAPAAGWAVGTPVEVDLDPAFVADLLGNGMNRGIVLWENADLPHPDDNWQAHMKEWGGGARAAYIRVEMIPEPATMVLLGLGGLGMLIRRKR